MPAPLTLSAIEKHLEETQEQSHRAHLGASVIGRKCARQLWYLFRWVQGERHKAQLLRLFKRGHLEEARFVEYLRAIGVEVWDTDPNAPLKDGKPQQFRFTRHEGHFGGALDGVARGLPDLPPDEPFTLEFKTHSASSFAKIVANGLLSAKWEHYVQMQVGMAGFGLNYGLYMAVNKDNDDLFLEIVRADQTEGERAFTRAGQIIWSATPPKRISESPAWFECKFCHNARLCHFQDGPIDRNCRTCAHSAPAKGGLWQCNFPLPPGDTSDPQQLDEAAQRAACPHYEVNPVLSQK